MVFIEAGGLTMNLSYLNSRDDKVFKIFYTNIKASLFWLNRKLEKFLKQLLKYKADSWRLYPKRWEKEFIDFSHYWQWSVNEGRTGPVTNPDVINLQTCPCFWFWLRTENEGKYIDDVRDVIGPVRPSLNWSLPIMRIDSVYFWFVGNLLHKLQTKKMNKTSTKLSVWIFCKKEIYQKG